MALLKVLNLGSDLLVKGVPSTILWDIHLVPPSISVIESLIDAELSVQGPVAREWLTLELLDGDSIARAELEVLGRFLSLDTESSSFSLALEVEKEPFLAEVET